MRKSKKHGNMAPWYYLSLLQILNNSYNKTRYCERDKANFAYFENEIKNFSYFSRCYPLKFPKKKIFSKKQPLKFFHRSKICECCLYGMKNFLWYTRCIGSWLLNTVKKLILHHLLPPYNGALPIYPCFLAMFAVGSALTLWPLAKTGVFLCLKLGLLVKICEKKIFQKNN